MLFTKERRNKPFNKDLAISVFVSWNPTPTM